MQLKALIFSFLIILSITNTIISSNLEKHNINGQIYDAEYDEPLTGATIVIPGTNFYAISGMDGSFSIRNIPAGEYNLEISFISYEDFKKEISLSNDINLNVGLKPVAFSLEGVVIITSRIENTEASARSLERNAMNSINAISAKAIEMSPDITVANVVQRVSGLTVERGSSGEAQYAIVRGMDKRYNYTLVNGIKIPSPDNENRYIPLDIFPADLLDQLVVSKSLTPFMEGDAIGGVVDMKMKSAHSRKMLSASFSSGYSELFLQRDFDYYNYNAVDKLSPMERAAPESVVATEEYYSTDNFNFKQISPTPDFTGSITIGDRFYDEKLGFIVAASYQNSNSGADRTQFRISETRGGDNLPMISGHQERKYSTNQERLGLHNKIDYIINPNHSISLYNVWLHLQKNQTRVVWEDGLRAISEPTLEYNFRTQTNIQRIYNSTLQGKHKLTSKFNADWSLVYSYANQNMPDNSQLINVSNYDIPGRELRWLIHENQIRIWENNSDRDYAVYYNLTYNPLPNNEEFEIKTGGLYRLKNRDNNFDLYTFKPLPGIQEYVPYETNYADINWRITGGSGTPTHALNYQSNENIFAHYLQFSFKWQNFDILGGVRAEHTDQGFSTANNLVEDGSQNYWNILPSLHLKYGINKNSHLRSSYYKSVSRPSFLEIIPYSRPSTEDMYTRGGNPNLRPVIAYNFDLRYELFPNATDQFLIGAFYKIITDPIEVAIMTQTDPNFQNHFPSNTTMLAPVNFETAINAGIEVDFIKYFNRIGIRANYTFTSSELESIKRTWTEITDENYHQLTELQRQNLFIGDSTYMNVVQQRPLQGQSKHLGNLSILYKDQKNGFDAQLSAVYTGERIAVVSTGYETDWWQKGFIQLDFSAEKRMFQNFVIFTKINNIMDTPYKMYIKKPHYPSSRINHLQPNSDSETLVRQEYYGRVYLIGLKYNF